jgi:hypothetical protein
VALVEGERVGFCCPACALSQHQQSGAALEVVGLTDHLTGEPLAPAKAYLVRGSDVNSCSHQAAALAPDKHPVQAHYDRCSPSLLAFSSESAARGFVRDHGGHIIVFPKLAAMFR